MFSWWYYIQENKRWHFIQIVSYEDNLYEMYILYKLSPMKTISMKCQRLWEKYSLYPLLIVFTEHAKRSFWSVADDILKYLVLYFREIKVWHLMSVICLADDSHWMSFFFSLRKMKEQIGMTSLTKTSLFKYKRQFHLQKMKIFR